ncbi:MAG: hypothetical protein WC889_15075, partial [Myxococcota bacterium]
MSRKIAIAAVIAAVAAAGYLGYAHFSKKVVETPIKAAGAGTVGYSIPDGLVRAYSFDLSAEAKIDTGVLKMDIKKSAGEVLTGKTISASNTSGGELRLKFYADQSGGWNVAGMLSGVKSAANGKSPDWLWATEYPFTFRMDVRGKVSAPVFVADIPGEAESFVLRIIYDMQAVLPGARQPSWTVEESGANGLNEVVYTEQSWDQAGGALGLKKAKRRVKSVAAKNMEIPFLANPSMNIIKSETVVSVTLSKWISELSGVESVVFLSDGKEWSRSDSRTSIKLIDGGADGFPATFAAFRDLMRSQKLVQKVLGHTDPELDRLCAGLNMDGALSKYLELLKTDKNAAEKFMVNYLRLNPKASEDLLRLLDRDNKMQRYDEKTQLVLWRLIIEAGTPEAQRAIISAAIDPSYSTLSHVRAIMYSIDFENPQQFMVDEMLRLHRNPDINGEPRRKVMTENMSLLAVGSMGYKDKLNEDTINSVAKELTDNLHRFEVNNGEVSLTLKAIGNTV